MTDDPRLPIKITRAPEAFRIVLADGARIWIYGRQPDIARVSGDLTLEEAEALAKEVARALTAQWGGDGET